MDELPVYLNVNGIILRLKKRRYYVSILENGEGGNVKELYVGPLVEVVETYIKLKNIGGVGVPPTMRPPGFEPGISGLGGQRPNQAGLRPHSKYFWSEPVNKATAVDDLDCSPKGPDLSLSHAQQRKGSCLISLNKFSALKLPYRE